VHWGTFALAMHAWDLPAESLLRMGPAAGAQLLMPRLGEAIEPARDYPLLPWWRAVEGSVTPAAVVPQQELTLPSSVPYPFD
jgi:hypothetical protein